MQDQSSEKAVLIIIDMVKDTFDKKHNYPIVPFAEKTFEPLNNLIARFRRKGWPIVFSTDSFRRQDFIFKGRMKPHSLAGTVGAEVVEALNRSDEDYWLPKPRFSAFFKTGLENWLRERGVTLCAVGGISTHFCVLATVMDAICHDFRAVMLEDCCAAFSEKVHNETLDHYRRNALEPLLRVMASDALAAEFKLV